MNYRGYTARVEFDPDERVFVGRVEGLRDVVVFQAADVETLEREFRISLDDYIASCEEDGVEPERPYSGRLLVRMPSTLHKSAAEAARRANVSLNTWVNEAIEIRARAS